MRPILLAVPVLLGATAAAIAAVATLDTRPGRLVLTAKEFKTGGIATAPLDRVERATTVTAFGAVLDPGKLAASAARVASAQAVVSQAKAKLTLAQEEAKRAAILFRGQSNISRAEYQKAQASAEIASADLNVAEAQLRSEQAQVRADWGQALGPAVVADKAPVPGLVNGDFCLIQITLPFGSALPAAPPQAQAEAPSQGTLDVRLIGPSPQAYVGSGPSYFYMGSGPDCPAIGSILEARLPRGPKLAGVVVPASAVVWHGGEKLAYRDDGAAGFAPVTLTGAVPVPGGYFVPATAQGALSAGQKIVVKGAGLLLSQAEMPAVTNQAAGGGDDD